MKCIIVFSGLSRCFETAYPVFKQYFMDQYDTEVYACFWEEAGMYSGKDIYNNLMNAS